MTMKRLLFLLLGMALLVAAGCGHSHPYWHHWHHWRR
jgi:hypothetical protein